VLAITDGWFECLTLIEGICFSDFCDGSVNITF